MIKRSISTLLLLVIHILFYALIPEKLSPYIQPDLLLLYCFFLTLTSKISANFYFVDVFIIVLVVHILSGDTMAVALLFYTVLTFFLESTKGILIRKAGFLVFLFLLFFALKAGVYLLSGLLLPYAFYNSFVFSIEFLYHLLGSLLVFLLAYFMFRTKIIRIRS